MRKDINKKINEPLVKRSNLSKIKNINSFNKDIWIKREVNNLYEEISQKYIIKEEEIYQKLYLKVRKLFLEE